MNSYSFSLVILTQFYEKIQSYSYDERISELNMNPDRADVIVPAGKIYLSVLNKCNIQKIIVPKIGLTDGIIYTLCSKNT